MPHNGLPVDHLISVPIALSRSFSRLNAEPYSGWFVASDPPGSQLGSAGGTAFLLVEAWKVSGHNLSFLDWLRSSKKIIVHGGGRSRRLPAYAPAGKPFIPMPVSRTAFGERLDQKLVDLQMPRFERLLRSASSNAVVLVASGDVLLDFAFPDASLPEVDVLCFGMKEEVETAQDFGVFFTDVERTGRFYTMLQKPTSDQIIERLPDRSFLIDTGMWLLSERAVSVLLEKTGWDRSAQRFAESGPRSYDLYGEFGLALGERPATADSEVSALSCAVFDLAEPSFLHLGTNRQLIESVSTLQDRARSRFSHNAAMRHPDIYLQNSLFSPPVRHGVNTMIWVENSVVPQTWEITREHVLTGIPQNDWTLRLEPGACLDFVPVGDQEFALRAYGFDDHWSGNIGLSTTFWHGRPASKWFSDRGISPVESGISDGTDIHEAPLHPVLILKRVDGGFVEWLYSSSPQKSDTYRRLWLDARRVSSQELNSEANLIRVDAGRREHLRTIASLMQNNARNSVFYRVDLEATAALMSTESPQAPHPLEPGDDSLLNSQAAMYQAAVLRSRSGRGNGSRAAVAALEASAFEYLRSSLVAGDELLVSPVCDILPDQIVWGRSPLRLDLAGGWTDTPPYCLQHGGRVLNVAVDLNGQPPIQVYAKRSEKCEIVIRSIDLGVEQRFRTYEDLVSYAQPGSEFALAKASLCLCGFLPRFHRGAGYATLEEQLKTFGGGIELSMVAAIPAGSGLGTSSILAATLLGTLSNLLKLNWSRPEIVRRSLVLEQMLTTGGGWQDPVGGVYGGLKLCESAPGLKQNPVVRWLPDTLFSTEFANKRILLYYTGITRMAKNILQDIVRGMFLNRAETINCLGEIGDNVDRASNAIQLGDYESLMRAVERSWELNKQLDAGTDPAGVRAIFERIQGEAVVGKLLGAGGGGFLLLLAKNDSVGRRLREILTDNPLNPSARFFDICTSNQGLTVTRS